MKNAPTEIYKQYLENLIVSFKNTAQNCFNDAEILRRKGETLRGVVTEMEVTLQNITQEISTSQK